MAACLATVGCDEEPQGPEPAPVDPCTTQPCDGDAPIAHLRAAYQQRDYARFASLLHNDFVFVLHPDATDPLQPTAWNKTEELRIHRRMFEPQNIPSGDEPLPESLWPTSVIATFAESQPFVERPEYLRSATNPDGLDPARWKAWGAEYNTQALLETWGGTDYQLNARAWFVVAQDLLKSTGEPGAFLLYRWQDLGGEGAQAAEETRSWSGVKNLYRPRACSEPCNPEAIVTRLGDAYARRDYATYAGLFHDDFIFILHPDPTDPTQPYEWGKTEELRIHKRMFEPGSLPPAEEPVPLELWLSSVTIALASVGPFENRPEFLRSPSNPDGLDPTRWKAWGAEYNASVLFETQGETDYQINGTAWFVVVQDLTKPLGDRGGYQLYRWQDLGSLGAETASVEPSTWSMVKGLYAR